ALRMSAAGLLAFCVQASPQGWQRRRYFQQTVAQLVSGLRFESDSRVREAIVVALNLLTPLSPDCVIDELYRANIVLKKEAVRALAAYCAIKGAKDRTESDAIAESVAEFLPFSPYFLKALVGEGIFAGPLAFPLASPFRRELEAVRSGAEVIEPPNAVE